MMNRAAEEMIRAATRLTNGGPAPGAHLNAAHVGHIQCALGTIHHGDTCAELRSDPWSVDGRAASLPARRRRTRPGANRATRRWALNGQEFCQGALGSTKIFDKPKIRSRTARPSRPSLIRKS